MKCEVIEGHLYSVTPLFSFPWMMKVYSSGESPGSSPEDGTLPPIFEVHVIKDLT